MVNNTYIIVLPLKTVLRYTRTLILTICYSEFSNPVDINNYVNDDKFGE